MANTAIVRHDFPLRLYGALSKDKQDSSLVLSPFSIQVALALCAAGARGDTRRVLVELIGAPPDVGEQNRQYAALLEALQEAGVPGVQLETANAIWVRQGDRLRPEFAEAAASFYDSACSELDFAEVPAQAVQSINAWVESKTAGKIKDLVNLQLITTATRLVLTSAIYFKGRWASEFDKSHTWDEEWHGAEGTRKVAMMHRSGAYPYYECAEFQAIDLPYRGEQLSLLVVLPRQKDGLAALERLWNAAAYQQVTASLAAKAVILGLPSFKVETSLLLRSTLCTLGAALAFSDRADFTGIAAQGLKISEVVHKAFIEVSEEGTEAAAATAVLGKSAGVARESVTFQADHPFLFILRERDTSAILFSGRVLQPEQ